MNDSGTKRPKANWAFVGFLIVAGFLLVAEHRAHLYGWVSEYGVWLLLLACPLLHLFMHHGHGDGHHADGEDESGTRK